jgi:flagellar protein FliO/FliZ
MTLDPQAWATAGAALLGVLALILLAGRLARRAGLAPRPGQGRLSIEESLALDARRRLVLVRCDGRGLLLLTGGPQDQVVGWLPPAAGDAP